MSKAPTYKPAPFDRFGRQLFAFLFAELVSIWIVASAALILLPTIVPSNFTWLGTPTSSEFSSTLIIAALIFSVVPAVILIVSLFRFRLLNKHPYLIKIPAFYSGIKGIAPKRRSYWVNQYFKTLLVAGVYLSGILLILILEIYTALSRSYINVYLSVVAPIIAIVAVAVLLLLLIKDLYRKMAAEAQSMRRGRR